MSSYVALAGVYDALTEDVEYERRADYLEKLFRRGRIPVRTVLDLACGTGEMTAILTERGYELIAVDGSPDMLAQAREKAADLTGEPPVFLNQDMTELDLYICSSRRGACWYLISTAPPSWRLWTGRSSWMNRRMFTVCGGRSMKKGAGYAPIGWIYLPAGLTAAGTVPGKSTGSGPIRWRSFAGG